MINKKCLIFIVSVVIVIIFIGFIIYLILHSCCKNSLAGGVIPNIPYHSENNNKLIESIEKLYKINKYYNENEKVNIVLVQELKNLINESGIMDFINNKFAFLGYYSTWNISKPDMINIDELNNKIDNYLMKSAKDIRTYDIYCFEILKIILSTYYYKFKLPRYNKTTYLKINRKLSNVSNASGSTHDIVKEFRTDDNKTIILKPILKIQFDTLGTDSYFNTMVQHLIISIILSEIPLFISFYGYGINLKLLNDKINKLIIGTEKYGLYSLSVFFNNMDNEKCKIISDNNKLNFIMDLLLSYLCLNHFHISHEDYKYDQYIINNDGHLKLLDFDESLFIYNFGELNYTDKNIEFIRIGNNFSKIITQINNKIDNILTKCNLNTNSIKILNSLKDELCYINAKIIKSPKDIVNYIRSDTFDLINDYRTKIINIINDKCILLNVDPIFGEIIYNCDFDGTVYNLY